MGGGIDVGGFFLEGLVRAIGGLFVYEGYGIVCHYESLCSLGRIVLAMEADVGSVMRNR